MADDLTRIIPFENIHNVRDIGGYAAARGKNVKRRMLFRSGGLLKMSDKDKSFLKENIRLNTVVDLKDPDDAQKKREIALLEEIGARYINIPFLWSVEDYYSKEMEKCVSTGDMGAGYLYRLRQDGFPPRLFGALEVIAEAGNQPLLIHCSWGKDRTGVVAAMLLNLVGVADEDIIVDYLLSGPPADELRERLYHDPDISEVEKKLLDFTWRAKRLFMQTFLDGMKEEYGSAAEYLKKYGAPKDLVKRLQKALLE
jgi:protein-tyrosine phosphatase